MTFFPTFVTCIVMHACFSTGAAILLGFKARVLLLRGTKRIRRTGIITDSGIIREYVKHGSYSDAIRDFNSVHPANIQEFKFPDMVGTICNVCKTNIHKCIRIACPCIE